MSNTIPEELLPEKAPFNIQMLDELFFEKGTNDIGLTNKRLGAEELEELMTMQIGLGLLEPECDVKRIVLHAHRDDRRQTMSLMFLGHEAHISYLLIEHDRSLGRPNFSTEKYFKPEGNLLPVVDIPDPKPVPVLGVCVEDPQLSNAFYKIMEYLQKYGNPHK